MNRIASERTLLKLTQAQLGDLIGVSGQTVMRWENGDPVNSRYLGRLRSVFRVDLDWLCGFSDERRVVSIED